jgi:hypothetical protein
MCVDDGLTSAAQLAKMSIPENRSEPIVARNETANRLDDERRLADSVFFMDAYGLASCMGSGRKTMLAATLRQEAARVAHENALRKRNVILVAKTKERISDYLKRR